MPRLSSWSVRASLFYLVLGFTIGGLMQANKGVNFIPSIWILLPAHIEFLLMGWTVQLALGVAFWILPRFTGGSRGNQRPAWFSLGLLNMGILLVAIGETLWQAEIPFLVGRLAEAGAGLIFVLYIWKRVSAPR